MYMILLYYNHIIFSNLIQGEAYHDYAKSLFLLLYLILEYTLPSHFSFLIFKLKQFVLPSFLPSFDNTNFKAKIEFDIKS